MIWWVIWGVTKGEVARDLSHYLIQRVLWKMRLAMVIRMQTESESQSRNYHSISLFKISNEKRPRTIVSWFWLGFRFAFWWPFRVSSSTERAVSHLISPLICSTSSYFYRALLQKRPVILSYHLHGTGCITPLYQIISEMTFHIISLRQWYAGALQGGQDS